MRHNSSNRDRRFTPQAFTIVELLVVIGIIGVLIGLLLPTLSRARERARLVGCASNLRQWGIALQAYANDNSGQLMETSRIDGSPSDSCPYPDIFNVNPQPSAPRNVARSSGMSVVAINRYLPSQVNLQTREFSKVFLCPSNVDGDPNGFKNGTWQYVGDPNAYFHGQYSYFAQVSKWQSSHGGCVSQPKLLCDNMLSGSRLLMCDFIYYWGATDRWAYNHGKNGASSYWSGNGILSDPGPPPITGVNKLYGDGHVEWDSDFDSQQMEAMAHGAKNPALRWVQDTGNWYTWY